MAASDAGQRVPRAHAVVLSALHDRGRGDGSGPDDRNLQSLIHLNAILVAEAVGTEDGRNGRTVLAGNPGKGVATNHAVVHEVPDRTRITIHDRSCGASRTCREGQYLIDVQSRASSVCQTNLLYVEAKVARNASNRVALTDSVSRGSTDRVAGRGGSFENIDAPSDGGDFGGQLTIIVVEAMKLVRERHGGRTVLNLRLVLSQRQRRQRSEEKETKDRDRLHDN